MSCLTLNPLQLLFVEYSEGASYSSHDGINYWVDSTLNWRCLIQDELSTSSICYSSALT